MSTASPPRTPQGGPRGVQRGVDLVRATVLFRRLLTCTLVAFGGIPAFEAFGSHASPSTQLLLGLVAGLCLLVVLGLAAVTATRLARELHLPGPWRYGFAAALPCPNLLAVMMFGAHMVPAWAAALGSPLLLLQPRRTLERRLPRARTPTRPTAFGFLATLVFLLAFVGVVGTLVQLAEQTPSPGGPASASPGPPSPSPRPDNAFYRAFAARGQAAFDEADSRLARLEGDEVALGNTPAALKAARQVSEAMERDVHKSQAAYPGFKPALGPGDRFRVYVYARPERAAVLIRVPRFETLPEDVRAALLHFAWGAATDGARSLRLAGGGRVALGLRGAGAYAAVARGDLVDDMQGPGDTALPADTAPVAAFFADVRLPVPVPTPSPGSTAARLLEQRRHGPLAATAEWKAYAAATSWDEKARQRSEAIRRYMTTEDVEDLLRAAETGAMAAGETVTALSLLGRLSEAYDSRIDLQQEGRLAAVLRERCSAPLGAVGAVCSNDLRRTWARMDHPFIESLFLQRLEETGRRDQDLWWLLIETRAGANTARWSGVVEKLVRTELGHGRGAGDAIDYWLEADPGGAERVVLEELSPRTLAPDARAWLAHALLAVALVRDRRDAAGARLAEIVGLGGPAAGGARIDREIIGLGPQDGIEANAREWRETRSAKSLEEIYNTYLIKLPMGAPFAPWRARLGDDDSKAASSPKSFSIAARDSGASLYVELDAEGRLRALSFK